MRRPVLIRRLRPSDATAVDEAVRESKTELMAWMDWCRPDYELSHAQAWIEFIDERFDDGSEFHFGIFDLAGIYLGQAGLSQINPQAKYANVGYWIRTSATRQGVATAAVRLLAEWAFDNTELQRLELVVALGNAASHRVAEKLGAVREGVLRSKVRVFDDFHDAVMYSIVRGDRYSE